MARCVADAHSSEAEHRTHVRKLGLFLYTEVQMSCALCQMKFIEVHRSDGLLIGAPTSAFGLQGVVPGKSR